jgi:hypothetical protein
MPDGLRDAFAAFGALCAIGFFFVFVVVIAVELHRRVK